MFFLITHIIIGKYYPSLFTQFIIGCSCYVLSFLILKDMISSETFDQYKYYAVSLVAVDTAFMVYKAQSKSTSKHTINQDEIIESDKKPENTSTDLRTNSLPSVTLSSEINDYKITHDLSTSDENNYDLFSTSDEKSDKDSSQASTSNQTSE